MLSERGIVEVIGLCGYYTMVSMTLNTFEFELRTARYRSLRSRNPRAQVASYFEPQAIPPQTVREIMPQNPPIIAGTRIGHVHLKVADLDRALGFYCGVLGFEVMERMGSRRRVHFGRRLPPPHRPQHLESKAAIRRPRHHGAVPHRHAVSDAAGVGRMRCIADRGGIQLDGASDHGVSEALYLRDPDENGVGSSPRSAPGRNGRAPDGSLAMFTKRLISADLLRQRET